jgi:translation initiation factor IF-3
MRDVTAEAAAVCSGLAVPRVLRLRGAESDEEGGRIDREPRINERILVSEVRLIGADGEQIGITPLAEALRRAREQDMDLVEVAADARPPVCRIMDYGKYKYQQAVKAKEARKRQSHIVIKEMKMRPKIDKHDYSTKSRHVERFLRDGSKVKATIMFRGREMAHQELGRRLLDRLAADMEHIAYVESAPNAEGRNMTMVLAPHKDPKGSGATRPAEGEDEQQVRAG